MPRLRVLSYSSFLGVEGPGLYLKKEFEKFCECEVQWFVSEDSLALWQRFVIIPDIDVVIGWDQFSRHLSPKEAWMEVNLGSKESERFLLLDWSPIGFLSHKADFPKSLKELPLMEDQISFPEPHSSTLGLQLFYWIYEVFKGNEKEISSFLSKLKPRIYGPLYSWSMAYGVFEKKITKLGLSYLSSLLYFEEKKQTYFFATFEEGHPFQKEYVSISKKTKNKELSLEFAKFLRGSKAQRIIRKRNFMFSYNEIPSLKYSNGKKVKLLSYDRSLEFLKKKKKLLELWDKSLR